MEMEIAIAVCGVLLAACIAAMVLLIRGMRPRYRDGYPKSYEIPSERGRRRK